MVVGCQPHAPAAFTPRDIPGTHFHEGLRTEMSTRNNSCGSYHVHVPAVLKSGSLNLLEPYGPVQAYNGIALP
jgi:hypothetical protein